MKPSPVSLIEFRIGGERYGLPMEAVDGVVGLKEGAGEVEIDGERLPVVDSGVALGEGDAARKRGVVVRGRAGRYVLAVDEVQGLLDVESGAILDPPGRAAGEGAGLVLGLAKVEGQLIVLLNPEALAT